MVMISDPGSHIAIDYAVSMVPETVIIGQDGKIAHKQMGIVTESLMRVKLDSLLAKTDIVIAALILVANLLVPQQAIAPRDSVLEDQVHQVGSKLRCPVCQGLSVAASPSANDMRDVIRSQLKAGKTPAEVEAYFVSKYGEWILLRPEPRGFNLALYVLPALMVLGGIGVIFVLARKWTRNSPAEAAPVE